MEAPLGLHRHLPHMNATGCAFGARETGQPVGLLCTEAGLQSAETEPGKAQFVTARSVSYATLGYIYKIR
jgi:hypothetical protein